MNRRISQGDVVFGRVEVVHSDEVFGAVTLGGRDKPFAQDHIGFGVRERFEVQRVRRVFWILFFLKLLEQIKLESFCLKVK